MFTPAASSVCMPIASPNAAADKGACDFFLALVPPLAPSIAAALLFWRFAVLPIAATRSGPCLSRDASPSTLGTPRVAVWSSAPPLVALLNFVVVERRDALSKTWLGKAHFGDDLWRVIGRRILVNWTLESGST